MQKDPGSRLGFPQPHQDGPTGAAGTPRGGRKQEVGLSNVETGSGTLITCRSHGHMSGLEQDVF